MLAATDVKVGCNSPACESHDFLIFLNFLVSVFFLLLILLQYVGSVLLLHAFPDVFCHTAVLFHVRSCAGAVAGF